MFGSRQQPWPQSESQPESQSQSRSWSKPSRNVSPSNPKKDNTHKSMGLTLSTAFGQARPGPTTATTEAEAASLAAPSSSRQMSCGKARGIIKLATNCFSRRFKYTFSILGHNERDCDSNLDYELNCSRRRRLLLILILILARQCRQRRHHWTLTNCPSCLARALSRQHANKFAAKEISL